ncbi:hypothetical protein M3Y99_00188800 [Aphelenchoides fujianensis]|nr:hypothetical protein M3Y99_00188800 [Aphelenchoides fujianensis]
MALTQESRAQQLELQRLQQLVGIARVLDADLIASNHKRSYTDTPIVSAGNLEVFESGNAFVDKLVTAFSILAAEVENLAAEARTKYFDGLLLVCLFVRRCQEVVHNLVAQLLAFYSLDDRLLQKAKERRLNRVWNLVGSVLVVLTTLDEIVASHEVLGEHFKLYQQTMLLVQSAPGQFGISAEDARLQPFFSVLSDISASILGGSMLQNCCTQTFRSAPPSTHFFDHFRSTITDELSKWERLAQEDVPDTHRLMNACSLSVLYFHLNQGKSVDKKLLRLLIRPLQKKLVSFSLVGDVMFSPTLFLLQRLPQAVSQHMDKKTTSKKALLDAFSLVLNQQAEQLAREAQAAAEMVAEWKTEMKAMIGQEKEDSNAGGNGGRANNLAGVRKADQIARLVKCVLNGHLSEDRSLSKQNALNIFRLVELIKQRLDFYHPSILEWNLHALLFLSSAAARIFEGVRTELSAKTMNPCLVDVISAIKLATLCVAKSPTKFRLLACGFALEIGHYQKFFRSAEVAEIEELLRKMRAIITMNAAVQPRDRLLVSFFWHRAISGIYFKSLFEDSSLLSGTLQCERERKQTKILGVLCSCTRMPLRTPFTYLRKAKHAPTDELIEGFGAEIFDSFKEVGSSTTELQNVLDPLCANVENDLRLSIHEQQNTTPATLQRLFDQTRATAGRSARNPADLVLAEKRFGLQLMDSNLPQMFINQGLDLLQIATNFDAFRRRLQLRLQRTGGQSMFIEKANKTKVVNVIRVFNLVGSIRTHGLGVLNTAINFAYQSLANKLRSFSRFLFNEQIRNQLVKDIRYYRDSMDELKQMYPVRRAERFNAAMSKLGVMADGQTFLAKFRELLTQIGNILGFVRMLRSAAAEINADGVDGRLLSTSGDRAGSAESKADYLEMLVSVFVKELRNGEKFAHLRNFFMIIPPVCVNFVEYLVACRQNFAKRRPAEECLTFTDDGFSLGIAYLLTLLNQTYFFDSLNWFPSVDSNLSASLRVALDEHQRTAGKDDSYAHTLKMRTKRLEEIRTEFKYLGQMLSSSLMLFKSQAETREDEDEMFLEDY